MVGIKVRYKPFSRVVIDEVLKGELDITPGSPPISWIVTELRAAPPFDGVDDELPQRKSGIKDAQWDR
jgi:hypothetical protein